MMEMKNQLASLEEKVFIIYYCFKYIFHLYLFFHLWLPFFWPRLQGSRMSARIKELEKEVGLTLSIAFGPFQHICPHPYTIFKHDLNTGLLNFFFFLHFSVRRTAS